jgi:UDP-3-O-[3-hydroxymyristoyl] glucosamine N-acyltransferase
LLELPPSGRLPARSSAAILQTMPRTVQQIAELVKGELLGPGGIEVTGVEQLDLAEPGQLTLVGDEAHARRWPQSRATSALVARRGRIGP